jgi:hypothetical protein
MLRRTLLLALLLPLSACSGNSPASPQSSTIVDATTPALSQSPQPPIPPEDRNPIPERNNALNKEPVVPNDAFFPELVRRSRAFEIPGSTDVARREVFDAAVAFGAALVYAIENPSPSSLNLILPGHPRLVALPAQMNSLGRYAAHAYTAVTGSDVGPSFPDSEGRVWVAVFQGASGPLGAVEPVCVAVVLSSQNDQVVIDLEEIPAWLDEQPVTLQDIPLVHCSVDIESPPNDGFEPAA